jgi:hypothetical protein
MTTINTQVPGKPEAPDLTIAGFWELTYWPFVVENLKPSTQWGYKQIWGLHLKPHFGGMTLCEYRTHHGSIFLTALSKRFARRTVQTVRSLVSGIFTHAVNLGAIESNPWHDVKVLGKTKAPAPTKHCTLEEIENIISALVNHVECQLIMALASFWVFVKAKFKACNGTILMVVTFTSDAACGAASSLHRRQKNLCVRFLCFNL